ncbi:MAG: CHAT domain-containing protein, partial [Cyanobacteria bacterium J06641_2]
MLLNDISIAYQQLGKLTEANKAVSTSLKLLEADVDKRNSSDKLVLLAQAFHIKGNLLKVKGDIQEASSAYTKALDNLESLSNDLTHINPAIQISLSGIAKGIYREKISTFFTKSKKTRLSQQNLEKVRQITESLYSAELYNYPHINFKDTDFLKINQIDSKAAVVYPILLQDSLEIIFHLPGKNLRHYSISIPKADVKNIVRKLKRYSNSKSRAGGNEIFQKASLQIYNWLIKPIESELQTSSVKTLVFVMDRELGNIPMASLYDGKQYLVEKYALALTPSLQVIEPQPYARRPLEAVIAGVVNFKGSLTLPYVQKEIANISSMIPSSIVLLNEAFTIEALKKAIAIAFFKASI